MRELDFLRVAIDETSECPYLPNQTSRMPLCLPVEDISPQRLDELLEAGYRRSGWFYYRTQCPRCQACEPLRVEVQAFTANRSQRRALKHGEKQLNITWGRPKLDEDRLKLFNKHRLQRDLDRGSPPVTAEDYSSFMVQSSCQTLELAVTFEDRLVAISITDVGLHSLSAVYCSFDPDYAWLGLGNYAILKQVDLGRQMAAEREGPVWLYLGLYVKENRHLNYKERFLPHERRIDGVWQAFQKASVLPE